MGERDSTTAFLLISRVAGLRERSVMRCLEVAGIPATLLHLDTMQVEGHVVLEFPKRARGALRGEHFEKAFDVALLELIDRVRPRLVIAFGWEASLICAGKSDMRFVSFLSGLDLAFSADRARLSERFLAVEKRVSAYLCENLLVQNELVCKGSKKPLLLWRPFEVKPRAGLRGEQAGMKQAIAFLASPSDLSDEDSKQLKRGLAKAFGLDHWPKVHAFCRDASPLMYGGQPDEDEAVPKLPLLDGQGVKDLLEGSVCIFFGDSDTHAAGVAAALESGSRVLLEDTPNNRLTALHYPQAAVHSRASLLDELGRAFDADEAPLATVTPRREAAAALDPDAIARLPWYHEDLERLSGQLSDDVVVFGAVAGFPLLTDRGRAVRIHPLLRGFVARNPVLLVQSSGALLARRERLLADFIDQGRVRAAYLEGSTAPVDPALQEQFFNLVGAIHDAGVPTAWHVIDAHYLLDDFGFSDDKRTMLASAGASEAQHAVRVFDLFCAPSTELFKLLVDADLYPESTLEHFRALPPGTDPPSASLPTVGVRARAEAITLVYCGGASGGVYRMELYHQMVREFLGSERLRFVFISREDEISALTEHYAANERERIEFLSTTLGTYRSQTSLTFGVTFFEHPYGKATVPQKLYSYLSHNMPVLAYNDCSYSKMIKRNKVGLVCRPTPRGLRSLLKTLATKRRIHFELDPFVQANTWDSRVADVTAAIDGYRRR